MGAPPKEMLRNSDYAMKFFDSDGKIILFFLVHCVGLTDG